MDTGIGEVVKTKVFDHTSAGVLSVSYDKGFIRLDFSKWGGSWSTSICLHGFEIRELIKLLQSALATTE